MPNWLPMVVFVMTIFAVSPILNNNAIKTHGPIINLAIINVVFFVLGSFWLFFYGLQDISLISKKSIVLTLISSSSSFVAIAVLFSVYKMAPKELSMISITLSFSVVVLAIINHFLGDKLVFHQWVGAIITFLGIVLVNYKK